jgi:hypothetical protein
MIRLLPLSWLLRLVRWTQPRSGAVLEAGAPSGREVVAQPPRGHACKLLALTAEAGVAQTACLPCRRLEVGSASARRLPTCDTAERHSALRRQPRRSAELRFGPGRFGSRRSFRPRSGRTTATGPRAQSPRAHGGGGRSADSLSAVSPTGSRQRVRPQVANLRHGRAPLCATVVTASRCRRSRSRRDAGRGGDGQSHTTHGRRWVSEGVRAGQRARGEDADPQIEVISECRCSFSCHRLSYQVPLQLPGRKSKLDRFQCFVERGDVL